MTTFVFSLERKSFSRTKFSTKIPAINKKVELSYKADFAKDFKLKCFYNALKFIN